MDEGIAQNDPVVDGINDLEASRLKAIKIHDSVCTSILPQLQKSMVKKVINIMSFLLKKGYWFTILGCTVCFIMILTDPM